MDLNQKQAVLNGIIKDKKARNQTTANEVTELKKSILLAEEDANHLKVQIVKSPEKVKQTIRDMEGQLDKEKSDFALLDKKHTALDNRMSAIKKIAGELAKCVRLLEEAQAVTEKSNNIKQRIKEQKKELEDEEQAKREIIGQREHIEKLIENVKIGIDRQEQFHIPKIRKVDEAISRARDELRQAEEMTVAVNARVHQNEIEMKQLEVERERMIRDFDMEMARMRETYEQLEATLVAYAERLSTLILPPQQPAH